jgi:hypothetical protein
MADADKSAALGMSLDDIIASSRAATGGRGRGRGRGPRASSAGGRGLGVGGVAGVRKMGGGADGKPRVLVVSVSLSQ